MAIMTAFELENRWLSLQYWLRTTVLPVAILLLGFLLILKRIITQPQYLDQSAALIAFFSLYFVLIRGGHLVMIRSMHFDLKTKYGERYEKRLARLPSNLRQVNLGFSLARIKRELIDNSK